MSRSMKIWSFVFVLFTFGLTACVEGREFRLGIISDKPVEKKISGYAPVAAYVAERLKPLGVTGGKVLVAGNVDEMLQKIRKGEVDVVLESPFPTLTLSDKGGMKPKLLVWKHGVREYTTVFIVRKDSPIKKLSDLKGKAIALQDPGSTSAFLIPIAELKRRGLKVVPANGQVPPSAVGYVLVAHEKNQAFWVIQQKADAAAFASDDWNDVRELEKRDLKVIYTTEPVLRYLASFHPDLPPDLSKAIANILVQMGRDPEGRKILKGASGTTKIEPLSAQDFRSLDHIRQLMQAR